MNCSLIIGSNSPQTFAALNISGAQLVESLDGNTSLVLECAGNVSDPYLIAPFQRCVLLVDNVVRFVGWLDEAPRAATASSERITYKLNGPMRWLQRTLFVQNFGGIVFVAGTANSQNQQAVKTWGQSLLDVLNDGNMGQYFNYSSAGWSSVYDIPTRPRSDISCYDALKTLMAYSPMTYIRWLYDPVAAGLPTLFVGDINDSIDRTLNASTIALSEATINPRYDLLVSEVKVHYMRDNIVNQTQISSIVTDADTLNANRSDSYTFDTSSVLNVPTSGLANAIKRFRGRLHIDGTASREGIDWGDEVGQTWGFAGTKFSQLSGYRTILNNIQRDLFRLTTSLEFGVTPDRAIYEVYNRSDFDRGAINPISTPSYTGSSNTAPYTPSNSSTGGINGSLIDPSSTITLEGTGAAGQIVTLSGDAIDASCSQTGYGTNMQCGLITMNGPTGSLSLDADELNGKSVGFREIQRCDGQKAMVLMSNWYT
jgi:hypothetical protein